MTAAAPNGVPYATSRRRARTIHAGALHTLAAPTILEAPDRGAKL